MRDGRIVLVGAGGHAQSCIDVVESAGFDIAGLVGLPDQVGSAVLGYKVIGSDADLPALAEIHGLACVVIGQLTEPGPRISAFETLCTLGFDCPPIVAPGAVVSRHATLGSGSMVMHGAIVNAGAVIGRNCIVNSRALIEHGARVGDHCHISTGAIVNGDVTVGEGAFVGSGATVMHGLVLGRRSVVGMGLSLRYDLADEATYTGRGSS